MSAENAPWQDAETLQLLYHEKEMSQREIAEELDCARATIAKWMDELEIKTRTTAGHRGSDEWREASTEENLRKLHIEQGLSTPQIADQYGVSPGAVWRQLDKHNLCRSTEEASKKANCVPRCSFWTDNGGHEVVQSWCPRDKESKRTPLHRLLAVAEFGFDAIQGKHVHHKNRIPWLNTPDNIELLTPAEHTSIHRQRGDF